METYQKVLLVDCESVFYRILRFKAGDFFGPVDLGRHLSVRFNSLNIGTGLLAGIFDYRAAEKLNQQVNMYGFNAISVGGVMPWLMEALKEF